MHLRNTLTYTALFSLPSFLEEVSARIAQPILNAKANAFIQRTLQQWNSPGGLSVAVASKDSNGAWRRENKGYGNATIHGAKFTEKTLSILALTRSTPKLFTAVATGLLIHNETLSPRLDWTTKLAEVLPGFDLADPMAAKGANIIDALAHRTGLPSHDLATKNNDTILTLIKKVKYQRPSTEFRDTWQYNNQMYNILSYLPTAVLPSKISFARYVKQNILDPLEMTSTTYSSKVANATGLLADGMIRQTSPNSTENGVPVRLPYWGAYGPDGGVWSGAGGIISNAGDMATWLQFLLLDGRDPKTNKTIVPEEAMQRLSTGVSVEIGRAQFPELSPVVYFGGQVVGSYQGVEYIEHGGHSNGYHSIVARYPNDDFGVVVVSNDENLGLALVQIVKFLLLEQALGVKEIDWTSRYQDIISAIFGFFKPTPRPSNASFPYGDIERVAGRYDNPGYGSVEFCLASSNSSVSSASCRELLADSRVLALDILPNVPTFIAKWDQFFVEFVVLSHFNGPVFNFTGYLSVDPHGSSKPFVFPSYTGATAEIDTKLSGVGITGVWGAVSDATGRNVKERAEVWYSRSI